MVDDAHDLLPMLLDAVDRLDWTTARAVLADQVRLDYTELFDGEPGTVSADDAIAGWDALLPGFDATQHLTGPVIVADADDGASATCRSTFRAYHVLRDGGTRETWMVAGRYDVDVVRSADGWKITALTLRLLDQEGSLDLPARAGQRVSAGSGGRVRR